MEVSWEVLGLARDVFRRQLGDGKMEMKPKLAEALQNLGEIAIEWENNDTALELLQESLSLRKESLSEDNRLIAETYYHIGIAFSFNNEVEKANDCFRSAVQVIEQRIENQKKLMATPGLEEDTKFAAEREVYDLESLLPEMKLKIEDSQDQMANASEAFKERATELLVEKAAAAKIAEVQTKLQAKPVSNISHLVKRKRDESGDPTTPKKLCTNNSAPTSSPAKTELKSSES
jgi:nuclear autoantigenic sperm protein